MPRLVVAFTLDLSGNLYFCAVFVRIRVDTFIKTEILLSAFASQREPDLTYHLPSVSLGISPSMKYDLICTDEPKNYKLLSCWPRKVKILHAFYGRATANVCQYKNFTAKQQCSYDGVTDFMSKRCNGRTSCFFDASTSLFGNFKDPCPGVSKYLQVFAKCV